MSGKPWEFACLECHSALEAVTSDMQRCLRDGSIYRCVDGIWRFLSPERRVFFGRFLSEYSTIRRLEGRAADNPDLYACLPYVDPGGHRQAEWRIRAASFDAFLGKVFHPLKINLGHPFRFLDLGAGSGWLSNQLTQQGGTGVAIDLLDNDFDGLGCRRFMPNSYTCAQAEFDRLPIADASVELVVFNAALHYSTDYSRTLGEAQRVLSPKGVLVILDTPIYHDPASGYQMVAERRAAFTRQFGFPSDALPSLEFLTWDRLAELGALLRLNWQVLHPWYGLRWALRPYWARLRKRREPAQFVVIWARKPGSL